MISGPFSGNMRNSDLQLYTLLLYITILYGHRGLKLPKIKNKLRIIPASEVTAQGKIQEHRALPCILKWTKY